jgi:predicted lipoprotein with Yx(FWY)xxD motif
MNGAATSPSLRARCATLAVLSMLVVILAGCAMSGSTRPARVAQGVLVDSRGMSLYTHDRDAGGKSACGAVCARNWPPLVATAADRAAGDYTIITRDDGSLQWAYKGRPLYRWIKDTRPGERSGDGFNRAWTLARP